MTATMTYIDSIFNILLEAASGATGYYARIIKGQTKVRRLVHTRWAIFRVLRSKGLTLDEIAALFGMDHSNISHGLRRGDELIKTDAWFGSLAALLKQALPTQPTP